MIARGYALEKPAHGTLGNIHKEVGNCGPEGNNQQRGAGNLVKKQEKRQPENKKSNVQIKDRITDPKGGGV